jgi:hypothetical protein
MKHCRFSIGAMVALVGLSIAAGTALAAGYPPSGWTPDGELIGRVQKVVPGAQQFQVLDRTGNQIQVVWPARPPQATRIYRDGSLVNTSALHEGDTVLLTGLSHGNWFEASRAEILTGERIGGATAPELVLRFSGFVSGRELRAKSADGTEYRIVFPPRPQAIAFTKAGNLANLSALREGDLLVAHGVVRDHVIRADRLEALDESRLGRGAPMPLRLTYRGSAGPRMLIGEAADGTRYTVMLPRRTQALYYVRNGALVEASALHPGDTIDVDGTIRGDRIDASQITIR